MSVNVGTATGYLDLDTSGFLTGLKSANSEATKEVNNLSTSIGKGFETVGSKLTSAGKTLTAGITMPIAAGVTSAVKEFADLEQAIGGVETLFKGSANSVIANSETAYMRAGASATSYMEQVTSFSARLLQSTGGDTEKAAKIADMAMVDMSDNANKFGTNIGSIQDAYQGFAKGNYTMLDNLKLGYGGTKTEMERLLIEAGKISGIEYNIDNLSDVYEAVHVIQNELGITGTTALEATETISGAFGMAKASVKDFLAHLGQPGADMEKFKQNMIDSLKVVVDNIKRVLGTIWENIPLEGWQKNMLAIAAAAGPLLLAFGKISQSVGAIIGAFAKVSSFAKAVKKGFDLVSAGSASSAAGLSKIGVVLGSITAPIAAVIAIVAVLVAAFVTLWKTNEEFRNKMTAIWNQIKDTFAGFIDEIKSRFEDLGISFKGITDTLWAIWKGFTDLLAPVFEGVFQQISNVIKLALDVIIGVLDVFIGIFTGNWEQAWNGIERIFSSIWEYISNTLSNVLNTMKGILDAILGWFGTTWEETWNGIKQFFIDIWNGIVSFFTNTLTGIQTFFQSIWDGITSFITKTLTTISTTFSKIWTSISTFTSTVWGKIKTNITNTINAIKAIIGTVFNAIKTVITTVLTAIRNTVSTIWNTIKTTISNVINSIKATIASVWNAIKTTTVTVWNAIKTAITTVLTAISTTVNTIWNTIKTTISNIINSIKATIDSVWNAIKTTTTTVWNAIKTAITVPIEAAKNTISNVINSIKSIFSSGLNAVKSTVTSIFDSIKSKIKSVMDDAKNIVSGAIDKIKSFFNFSWSLPKLKMPHFKVSGKFSLNPPSVPSFGVEWYKKAMGGGMILDSPTIFGFNPKTGKLLAGGEAGSETVVGTKSLLNMIKTAVHESNVKIIQTITGYFDVILDNIKSSNEKLLYSVGYLVTASYQFAQACEDLSYVAYNGFVKSEQAIVESNKSKPVDEGGDTFIFNSPKPIDEIEAANQLKKTKRDLSEGF